MNFETDPIQTAFLAQQQQNAEEFLKAGREWNTARIQIHKSIVGFTQVVVILVLMPVIVWLWKWALA